jgi:hypothetical protein
MVLGCPISSKTALATSPLNFKPGLQKFVAWSNDRLLLTEQHESTPTDPVYHYTDEVALRRILTNQHNKCVVPGLGRWRLPSEGKGHTFESCRVRQFFLILQRDMLAWTETPALRHSSKRLDGKSEATQLNHPGAQRSLAIRHFHVWPPPIPRNGAIEHDILPPAIECPLRDQKR